MFKKSPLFLQLKKGLIFIFFLFFSSFSYTQQQIIVKGIVLSENNVPLIRFSENIKGSSAITPTDREGKFQMRIVKELRLFIHLSEV